MDEARQPGIQIGQIFLERAEFSHREDVLMLPANAQFQPDLVLDFQGGVSPDEKRGFVRVTVKTKAAERPLYNFTVTMMALLSVVEGHENLSLTDYVQSAAPAMLYPFIREAVAALTWRGRFGPLWLAPFNVTAGLTVKETARAKARRGRGKRKRRQPAIGG